MEKKPGFKECPRCGLRNKISAIECDFCGWRFSDVKDEWTDHLLELERIALQEPEKIAEKEDSRIVKATLFKVRDLTFDEKYDEKERSLEEYPPLEKASGISKTPDGITDTPSSRDLERPLEDDRTAKLSPSTETAQPLAFPIAEKEEVELERLDQETTGVEAEVEKFVETIVEREVTSDRVAVEEVSPESDLALGKLTVKHDEVPAEASDKAEFSARPATLLSLEIRATLLNAGFVIVGFSVYLAILLISSSFTVNWFLGWAVSIAGAIMIVFGFTQIIGIKRVSEGASKSDGKPSNTDHDGGELEVLICPVCHEVVSFSDQFCPACGAIFESSEQEGSNIV